MELHRYKSQEKSDTASVRPKAIKYCVPRTPVELNPVKAKIVTSAWDYRWSSVHAHLSGNDPDNIIEPKKLLSLCGDWRTYLKQSQPTLDKTFEQHGNTGRPLGEEHFIDKVERVLGRDLKKQKPGPKSKK